MTISIDWGTKIINVPKLDLGLIQEAPTEIRELNLNTFRLVLKDLEDDEAGISYPKTHNNNAPVTVGGVQLARVIEILDPYTVTFENGQYAVNLVGANSNVADKTNVNQVSIRSGNSAGLIQTREIEYSSFNNGVTINTATVNSGILYPCGTRLLPVNNLSDAKIIANLRGFENIYVVGTLNINNGEDISNLRILGEGSSLNVHLTHITLEDGCVTQNTFYHDAYVEGKQNGESTYHNCVIGNLTNSHCEFLNCNLLGPIHLNNSSWLINHKAEYINCLTVNDWFIVDYNNSPLTQIYSNFSGNIKFTNCTNQNANIEIRLLGGMVWVHDSNTAGKILITGVGKVINNGNGIEIIDNLTQNESIANSVWSKPENELISGVGVIIKRIDQVSGDNQAIILSK